MYRNASISLDTTSPEVGTTLEPELINARAHRDPGSGPADRFVQLSRARRAGHASSHAINGGVTFENEVQFNGVPVAFVQFQGNQTNINPPYEAVNEFRVNTSTFNAQYGIGQGAVTFSMASGTNDFHGDAFEILRNQLFDSAGFFPTRFSPSGTPEPPINQQNNYGFTVGGPVWIPKVYNGKNRTFFHVSADWFRQNQAQNSIGTVPTAAMKSGDFSNFVDSSGNLIPIYDPTTGQPFPGNKIPQQRFSALSQSLLCTDTRSGHGGNQWRTAEQQTAGDSLHSDPPDALGLHDRREPDRFAEHSLQPVARYESIRRSLLRLPLCHPLIRCRAR